MDGERRMELLQSGREVAIDLDRGEPRRALEQAPGQRAEPRPISTRRRPAADRSRRRSSRSPPDREGSAARNRLRGT
jgi:hypothetical protein